MCVCVRVCACVYSLTTVCNWAMRDFLNSRWHSWSGFLPDSLAAMCHPSVGIFAPSVSLHAKGDAKGVLNDARVRRLPHAGLGARFVLFFGNLSIRCFNLLVEQRFAHAAVYCLCSFQLAMGRLHIDQ